jgi:hypothetical protein
MARQAGPLGAHPSLEHIDRRADLHLSGYEPLPGTATIDVALERKDHIDLPHGLQRQRRLTQLGQLIEIPSRMRSTPGLQDRPQLAYRRVEFSIAAIGISLQDATVCGQMLPGMLTAAVGRVTKERGRWRRSYRQIVVPPPILDDAFAA